MSAVNLAELRADLYALSAEADEAADNSDACVALMSTAAILREFGDKLGGDA